MPAVPEFIPLSRGKEMFAVSNWRDSPGVHGAATTSAQPSPLMAAADALRGDTTGPLGAATAAAGVSKAAADTNTNSNARKQRSARGQPSPSPSTSPSQQRQQQPVELDDYLVTVHLPPALSFDAFDFELQGQATPLRTIDVGMPIILFPRQSKEAAIAAAAAAAATAAAAAATADGEGEGEGEDGAKPAPPVPFTGGKGKRPPVDPAMRITPFATPAVRAAVPPGGPGALPPPFSSGSGALLNLESLPPPPRNDTVAHLDDCTGAGGDKTSGNGSSSKKKEATAGDSHDDDNDGSGGGSFLLPPPEHEGDANSSSATAASATAAAVTGAATTKGKNKGKSAAAGANTSAGASGGNPLDDLYQVSLLFAELKEADRAAAFIAKRWPDAKVAVAPRNCGLLNASLVLKGLPNMHKTEYILEELEQLPYRPSYYRLHRGERGVYKNVVFVKYPDREAAEDCKLRLERVLVGNRPLKVEFKRKAKPVANNSNSTDASSSSSLSPYPGPPNGSSGGGGSNGTSTGGLADEDDCSAGAGGSSQLMLQQLARDLRVSSEHEGIIFRRPDLAKGEIKLLKQLCQSYGLMFQMDEARVTVRRPLGAVAGGGSNNASNNRSGATSAGASPALRPANQPPPPPTPAWTPATPTPLRPMDFKGISHWKDIRAQQSTLGIVRPVGPEDGGQPFSAGRGRPV